MSENSIKKVSVQDAARELGTTALDIREALIHEELPIGYAIKRRGSSRYTYTIFRGLLDGYKKKIREGLV